MNTSDKTVKDVYCLGKQKGVICGIFIGVGGVLLGACAVAMLIR